MTFALIEPATGTPCEAAIKAAGAVLSRRSTASAHEVFETLNWWTPQTVREALEHLADTGQARRFYSPKSKEIFYQRAADRIENRSRNG